MWSSSGSCHLSPDVPTTIFWVFQYHSNWACHQWLLEVHWSFDREKCPLFRPPLGTPHIHMSLTQYPHFSEDHVPINEQWIFSVRFAKMATNSGKKEETFVCHWHIPEVEFSFLPFFDLLLHAPPKLMNIYIELGCQVNFAMYLAKSRYAVDKHYHHIFMIDREITM